MIARFLTALAQRIDRMFSDDDGRTSMSRVATFISLLCSLEWVHFIVHTKGALPDPLQLAGLAAFNCALMTINRSDNIVAAIRGTHVPTQSPPKGEGQS